MIYCRRSTYENMNCDNFGQFIYFQNIKLLYFKIVYIYIFIEFKYEAIVEQFSSYQFKLSWEECCVYINHILTLVMIMTSSKWL